MNCLHCQTNLFSKYSKKFCSRSCSASYTNKEKVKHGRYVLTEKPCSYCNNHTTNNKFCSKTCMGKHKTKYLTDDERKEAVRKMSRESYARYSSRKKYQTPTDEDLTAIKEFYKHCPKGYEVDHIIPISKGGRHSISNLQYLKISENRQKGAKLDWRPRDDSNVRPHS